MVYQIIISILLGFVSSVFLGFILIPLLRKLKAKQSINYYLRDKHHSKEGTPTMGGLIFVLPTLFMTLVLIITGKLQISYTLLIVLFTFCGYMLIGFVDDYLIARKHNNKGLSRKQKLAFQLIIALIFFYLFMKGNNEPVLWIHSINFRVNIGFFYGLFILFVLLASSNAVNLTDGLDGLAAGLSSIYFITIGIVIVGWKHTFGLDAIITFIMLGSTLGFLSMYGMLFYLSKEKWK